MLDPARPAVLQLPPPGERLPLARTLLLLVLAAAAAGCNGVVPFAELDDVAEPTILEKDAPVAGLSGGIGRSALFAVELPPGAMALTVRLGAGTSPTNDADLYVRAGEPPTPEQFDCRSANIGLSESCTVIAPTQGRYFVRVIGATAFADAELSATYRVRAPRDPSIPPGASVSVHVALGLPDGSKATMPNADHFLSVKPQYVVSYNAARKVANWASWELNSSYLGSVMRAEDFRPDDTLPPQLAQATNDDYLGSGFDRGHLCPSADRTRNAADNSATFYLSNMIPQSANNNRGPWGNFEIYERQLVRGGSQLFVVAGGVFEPGGRTVGSGVAVPTSTFKVVVVLPAGATSPGAVETTTRVIALLVPNDDTLVNVDDDWRKFRVSPREIEARTGLDFLGDVPVEIQDALETRVDDAR